MERKFKIGDRIRINPDFTDEMRQAYDDEESGVDMINIDALGKEGTIIRITTDGYHVILKNETDGNTYYDFEMQKINTNTRINELKKELIRRQQNGI